MNAQASARKYWVYGWLDEYKVGTIDTARLLLANPIVLDDLAERARRSEQDQIVFPNDKTSILAGRGIDLSGQLDCNHWDCKKKQIDRLFGQVWLYFDEIVVQDTITHEVAYHWDNHERRTDWLLSQIQVLLYLREIKADSLLRFLGKPPGCTIHLRRHTEEAGLTRAFEIEDTVVGEIERTAQISLEREGDGSVSYSLDHTTFVHTRWGRIPKQRLSGVRPRQLRRLVIREEIRGFLAFLNSDVMSARGCGAPLGAVIPLHRRLLSVSPLSQTVDVAMNLELPVLNRVPAEILVEIRLNEREHFARFRTRLRLAIQERVMAAKSENAAALAFEIRRDLIDPELTAIRDRLTVSERTMAKKSAVSVFVGALATTCGLISGLPAGVAVSAGVAATLGMTQSAASKYLDEKAEISLSDMYFAWQAMQHAEE
jgi:hypothetical protein